MDNTIKQFSLNCVETLLITLCRCRYNFKTIVAIVLVNSIAMNILHRTSPDCYISIILLDIVMVIHTTHNHRIFYNLNDFWW